MEKLIELAERLGKMVAEHERTAKYKKAQQALKDDAEARQLVQEHQQQAEKIMNLEREQQPIEVDDKRKLSELEGKISTNAVLRELMRRQVDFVEMTRKLHEAIYGPSQLGAAEEEN